MNLLGSTSGYWSPYEEFIVHLADHWVKDNEFP